MPSLVPTAVIVFKIYCITLLEVQNTNFVCPLNSGARCSSVVRAFAHGAMGPLWGGPIELFLFPASAPRLV